MKHGFLRYSAVLIRNAVRLSLPLALCAAVSTSCIDEDLSKCGVDHTIDYNVQLSTELHSAIHEVMPAVAEQGVAKELEAAMSGEWADKVHDLDLSFYNNHDLVSHQNMIINASSASLTLYMRNTDYRHLALANATGDEQTTSIAAADDDRTMAVATAQSDTINSHVAPIYSARLDMNVGSGSRVFRADLYMLNSMVGVVLADTGHVTGVEGYVDGMATSFAVNDSVYSFDRTQLTRMNEIVPEGYHCLYATTMPSRDGAAAAAATGPAYAAADGIWQIKVYVSVGDKITENILRVNEPLRAGRVKIIKGKVNPDGGITTDSPEVGVSVTLNWKPGGDHNVEI